VSSAIGNEPPPLGIVKALDTSSMATTALQDTLEKMISKAFPGKRKLYQGRNYCEVRCGAVWRACGLIGGLQVFGGP